MRSTGVGFGTGTTLASFQIFGSLFSFNEQFMIFVIGDAKKECHRGHLPWRDYKRF